MQKSFRELLHAEHRPIGTILQLPSEELVEILGHAGVEFLTMDTEHCPMSHAKIVSMIRTAEAAGVVPMVRVPDVSDEDSIKKALDGGAAGVLVPNISTAEQARLAVRYGKYAPMGNRGACPYVRANSFGGGDCANYYERANAYTSINLLVEGPEGVQNLPEIVKVEGIDSIQIGAVDLSVSLGIPGQTNHPLVRKAIQDAGCLAAENGKVIGFFCSEPEDVSEVRGWEGIGYYLCPIPEAVLHERYRSIVKTMNRLAAR